MLHDAPVLVGVALYYFETYKCNLLYKFTEANEDLSTAPHFPDNPHKHTYTHAHLEYLGKYMPQDD